MMESLLLDELSENFPVGTPEEEGEEEGELEKGGEGEEGMELEELGEEGKGAADYDDHIPTTGKGKKKGKGGKKGKGKRKGKKGEKEEGKEEEEGQRKRKKGDEEERNEVEEGAGDYDDHIEEPPAKKSKKQKEGEEGESEESEPEGGVPEIILVEPTGSVIYTKATLQDSASSSSRGAKKAVPPAAPATIPKEPTKDFATTARQLPENLKESGKKGAINHQKVYFHPRQLAIIEGVNYRRQYSSDCEEFKKLKASMTQGWLDSKFQFQ